MKPADACKLVLLAALALSACDAGATGTPGVNGLEGRVVPTATPATPPPRELHTPIPVATLAVATPEPATPTPDVPSTAAASPSASPSPVATVDVPASGAPTPAASPYKKTGVATDLAVSGPAYFVMATKPDPETVDDLLFTRNGHFAFAHDTAGTLSLWRLRHATDNFFVVGFMLDGGTAAGAPAETSAADHAELATTWAGQPTQALGLFIDADRNPDAPGAAAFDFTGRVTVGETAPRGPDGNPIQTYVALATFATPAKLVPQPGFDGVFKYAPAAGALSLGVAVSGDARPVGNANLILISTLAQDSASPAAKP